MSVKSSDGWIRVFEVTEPTKHRKGFTVYKVISRVFHKNSVEGMTEIVTHKRFSEFKSLHKSLSKLHISLHLKGEIPSFPESKLFGRFDAEVIEKRRQSALELLEFAAKYPPLFTNSVFVKFFEKSTTNFTPISLELIDNQTQDNQHLPQPLEPNKSLSPSDDCSTRSDYSDGSSYYSTPLHSIENSTNGQNCENNNKSDLKQFDPLVTINDMPFESSETSSEVKPNNNWFIYAIQSCDNESNESKIKIAAIDSNDSIPFPKPFSELNLDENIVNPISIPNDAESGDQLKYLNSNSVIASEVLDRNENRNETMVEKQWSDTYLLDAATLISQAQQHEQSVEYEAAFESYKCAVGILLQGVCDESDSEKKASIRRKTFQYLTRAEHIYDNYLNESQSFQPNRRWAPDSPFKAFSKSFISSWFGSYHELNKYKVIGIVSKVQIVIDTMTNNIFAIKVIYKTNVTDNCSSLSIGSSNCCPPESIFPHDIPYMVQIYRIFKTEYALFLLLEFAKGGKLLDKISNSEANPLSPCPDCTFTFDDKEDYLTIENPYTGRRLSRAKSESGGNVFSDRNLSEYEFGNDSELHKVCSPSGSLVSIESIDSDLPSKSYLSLCNNYAFSQQSSEHSTLANCKINSISDSIDSIDSITCESEMPNRSRNLSQSKRQLSVESLGISGLLAKARGILRNVDQTLRSTKPVIKQEIQFTNKLNFRESKSEMSLSFIKSRKISEVFHQMDTNSVNLLNRAQVPEEKARLWLSQIVRCLQHLHKLGIIYCDLKPENLLLSENENIMISYKCFWDELPHNMIDDIARDRLYVAPELIKSEKISHLCDWWSIGVIAYELLTSRPLVSYHPNGISSHTSLFFPNFISLEAKDLINKLLQPNPNERLGRHGSEEILSHPFFEGINWSQPF